MIVRVLGDYIVGTPFSTVMPLHTFFCWNK